MDVERHQSKVLTVYLTNGVFLYRVAGVAPGRRGATVELEDCYLLDVVHVSISDLRARGLRVVTPARTDGVAPDRERDWEPSPLGQQRS